MYCYSNRVEVHSFRVHLGNAFTVHNHSTNTRCKMTTQYEYNGYAMFVSGTEQQCTTAMDLTAFLISKTHLFHSF